MQAREKVQVWVYWQDPATGKLWFLVLKTRPERGSFWQPVTGGVEPGETLSDAALREACEETHLSFRDGPAPIAYSFEFESRGGKCIEHGFSLCARMQNPVVLDSHEHTEFCWVLVEDALRMIHHSSNQKMLRTFLDSLS